MSCFHAETDECSAEEKDEDACSHKLKSIVDSARKISDKR